MICVNHNPSLPQCLAPLGWPQCRHGFFFLFKLNLFRFKIVSLVSLNYFACLKPLTVDPSLMGLATQFSKLFDRLKVGAKIAPSTNTLQ